MRRWMQAIVLATMLAALTCAGARAETSHRLRAHERGAPVTFRLEVAGHPAVHATFWVAYGPLAGRFGLIQLRDRGGGLYTASATLSSGRTIFAFLEGFGVEHTRLGDVPGAPTYTIREVGPMSVPGKPLPTIRWHVPLG